MGRQAGGKIIASYATGNANGGMGGYRKVGGLVGWQFEGEIIASYATGDANGGIGDNDRVGGLVGLQSIDGSIIASYATGIANGGAGTGDEVGGLVGLQSDGSDTASYGFGTATGGAPNMIGNTGLDVNTFTASDAGTQWGGSPSPWIFSSGLAPRLGYITGRTGVTYTCDLALLPEGVACGDELPGQ